MDVENLIKVFKEKYKNDPRIFQAPGRVNLIGEHTDYNEGYVLPAAIDRKMLFAIRKNNSGKIRLHAIDYHESFEIKARKIQISNVRWANYLLGVIVQFQKRGLSISGIDCAFCGNIPDGAGLSSSAALESGFAFAINTTHRFGVSKIDLAKMSQKAEHEFAGVFCGIMDQFTSFFGKKDQVIQLDCRSLNHTYFPLELKDHVIILCDTLVKHSLASTAYNTRRTECENGVTVLQQFEPLVKSLRDIKYPMLQAYKSKLDALIYKRCRYVIMENERVRESGIALQGQDIKHFGRLMFQSHVGLRDEYEVSCKELDLLVEIAVNTGYVTGARMMGGGFGGCTINLVEKNHLEDFKEIINAKYFQTIRRKPQIYEVNICDGASEVIQN